MDELSGWPTFVFKNVAWLFAAVFAVAYFVVTRRLRYVEDALTFLVKSSKTTSGVFIGTRHWDEQLYLAVNPDVAAAVASKTFASGREHYELAGRAEHRKGGWVPPDWKEEEYLEVNPDVARAVFEERFVSGYHHYLVAGENEGRKGGLPSDHPERANVS